MAAQGRKSFNLPPLKQSEPVRLPSINSITQSSLFEPNQSFPNDSTNTSTNSPEQPAAKEFATPKQSFDSTGKNLPTQVLEHEDQQIEIDTLTTFLEWTKQQTKAKIATLQQTLEFIEQDLRLVEKLNNNIKTNLGKRSYDEAELTKYSQKIRNAKKQMLESHLSTLQKNYNETHVKFAGASALQQFSDNFTKFTSYTSLSTLKTFTLSSKGATTNETLISSVDFDKDDIMFAAACNKSVKIYKFVTVLQSSEENPSPLKELEVQSRVTKISYNSYFNTMLAGGTNTGSVVVWNTRDSAVVNHWEEHDKCVWSVDFSEINPTTLASGSDDKMVKIWYVNQKNSALTINTPTNVCCVRFNPFTQEQIALGSADHTVYIYDLRFTQSPFMQLKQHKKAVSHLCFRSRDELLSSSIDGTIKLWNISLADTGLMCTQTYKGHLNEKHFVGLSCTGEYFSVGGEDNSVVTYHKQFPDPAIRYSFGNSNSTVQAANPFISSLSWKHKRNALVAANSQGEIRLLKLA